MSFLDYVLQVPFYGWVDNKGTLVMPTNQEILKEFFSRLNLIKSRKNWLSFFSWFKVVFLAVFFVVFVVDYLNWWIFGCFCLWDDHPSYKDHDFAKRMFQYYDRLLDLCDKPITAFAIFADPTQSFHPKNYVREFLGTKVYYGYNTYKIIDQDNATLKARNNPFAMAVLSAKLMLSGPLLGG